MIYYERNENEAAVQGWAVLSSDPLVPQFGRVGGGTQAYVDAGAEGEVSITYVF